MPDETPMADQNQADDWQKLFDRPRIFSTPKWRRKPSENYTYNGSVLSINRKKKPKKTPSPPKKNGENLVVFLAVIVSIFILGLLAGAAVSIYLP